MSNNSTNGEYKKVEESQESIEARIKKAEYDFTMNYLEARFKEQISQERRTQFENSGSSDDTTSENKKVDSNYVIAGNSGNIIFKNVIPAIANGQKVGLKNIRDNMRKKNKVEEAKNAKDDQSK